MSKRNHKIVLAAALAVTGLAGCEGLGEGNAPEALSIGQGVDGIIEATECDIQQLTALAEFSNGGVGVFTDRVVWRSSDESVVRVSNRDIEAPSSGGTFGSGVMIPVAPGTASVFAELAGLETRVDVVVDALDGLAIDTPESTTAIGATRFLRAVGDKDGEELDLSIRASWSFDDSNEDVATIDYAQRFDGSYVGVIEGLAEGERQAVAVLDFCEERATAVVRVAPVQTLELRREYEGSTQLVTGTTEFMYPFALFENGDEQDLDGQVIFTSSDEEVVLVDAFSTAPSLVLALAAGGPVQVTATFGAEEPEEGEEIDLSTGVTSAPQDVTVVDAVLTSLDITPDAPTVAFGDTLDFVATGSFDDGAFEQVITRSAGWSTDDTDVARFGNTFLTANRFFPLVNEAGQSIVTARFTTGGDDTIVEATETVTIEPAVDEDTEASDEEAVTAR